MLLYIAKLFLCFIFFSFAGWCLEVLFGLAVLKRFVNRGFLMGPLCPLYGAGCVLLYVLLGGLAKNGLILFILSMLICSALEYAASYILEKIFKTRWWDYNNMKFNINGRICLELIIPFGILGLFVVYLLFPFSLKILDMVNPFIIYIVSIILLIIFMVDVVKSTNFIKKFKTDPKNLRDTTEELRKFIRKTLRAKHLKKQKK